MTQLLKSNCPACGAPITIPVDEERLNCANCGSAIIIEKGEGYYTLKSAEKIAHAIEQTGSVTRDAIRENTNSTKSELLRLKFSQELASAQIQLSNTRAEIRLLERSPNSKKIVAQLHVLHQLEFQTMEQIRSLQKQSVSPTAEDLNASLSLAEWERSWILEEIQALEASDQPKLKQNRKVLYDRIGELSKTILQIKIKKLKSLCQSFQLQDPLPDNDPGLRNLLAIVLADEHKIRDHRRTAEGKILLKELSERRKRLERILRSNQQKRSTVIDNRVEKNHNLGIFAGLVAGTAGLIAGGVTLASKKHDVGSTLESPDTIRSAETPSPLHEEWKHNFGSHGTFFKGLLLGFLVFIGIVIVGLLLFGLFNSSEKNIDNLSMGFLVFCIAIGFGVGSYVFLRHAAPKTTVHLSEKMRDIVITPKAGSRGVQNSAGVKIMLAIITCILVYLTIIALVTIIIPFNTTFGVIILMIGFVIGPLSAWYVAKRTSISSTNVSE